MTTRNLRSAAIVLIAALVTAPAQATDQRLKVEGVWDDGIFHVQRIKERDPSKNVRQIRITGLVTEVDPEMPGVQIGPVTLVWPTERQQEFAEIREGDVLEVDAIQTSSGEFVVVRNQLTTIDTSDSLELIGALTGYDQQGEWTSLWLAGIAAQAPRRLFRNGRMQLQRLDDRRPENQYVLEMFGVATTIGGELEIKSDGEADRDLSDDDEDREADVEQQAQLEAFFDISERLSAFAELKFERTSRYDIPWERTGTESEFKRGEFWFYLNEPFGLPAGLQVGRQNFAEDREWWWDTDLDALRVDFRFRRMTFEFALAEELGKEVLNADHADAEDQDVLRLLARSTLPISSWLKLDAFLLYQDDKSSAFRLGDVVPAFREDEDDADLTWYGLRASGRLDVGASLESRYWIDVARVTGDETHYEFEDVGGADIVVDSVVTGKRSGWAYDALMSFKLADSKWGPFSEPSLAIGHAVGSGGDGTVDTFRQTGLNDNNGKYHGVNRFRYYGELSRPELSNLRISTISAGIRLAEDSSLELVYHTYDQVRADDRHTLRIDADGNGLSTDLGREFNVVLGIEPWEHWEFEAVLSHFIPGSAFETDDPASAFSLKLDYNF